jgi:molybdopterin-guanine dinucleotide biosynthesis protein A
VVLAGGAARRFGGDKMRRAHGGRPLLQHAIEALWRALDEVVVVAKATTSLPPFDVPLWLEPDEPRHPLAGVAFALEHAAGRSVLVLAGDMPTVPAALLRRLAGDRGDAPAVVPRHAGGPEPLAALYRPAALAALRAGAEAGAPARSTVEALGADWVEWEDAAALRSVNRPEDLRRST